uniref:Uncharacterized protein n=1 Tax=Rhizophora mucronata TaxID=61149 RepID=A0A2P2N824_RHIMU
MDQLAFQFDDLSSANNDSKLNCGYN